MAWWVRLQATGWLADHYSPQTIGPFEDEDEAQDYASDWYQRGTDPDDEQYDDELMEMSNFILWDDDDEDGTKYVLKM